MAPKSPQSPVWALVERQHGVVSRRQLLELGLSSEAIQHRIARGRLHPLWRGTYAVGRAPVSRRGRWMAATLCCGAGAVLSHETAAALWGIREQRRGPIHVTVPAGRDGGRRGIVVHRRRVLGASDLSLRDGIPVTSPTCTLVDLAAKVGRRPLEAAVNEADKLDLVDPESLRAALGACTGRPGVPALRDLLDRRTFVLTGSELERLFLPIARAAGLPRPRTGVRLNGFVVDFHWPELGLVVETDGLRYHRTPAQQARDRLRDQRHAAAGLTTLRFTHAQVRFEPGHVRETLRAVAERLRARRRLSSP
jgi:very-short-patch-repair endonuclease